jgi:putative tryptophan/tyrosine transport system substrate-binding protein
MPGSHLQGLRNLGWAEGRNIRIDYRWSADDADRTQNFTAELVIMRPDLIVAGPLSTAEPPAAAGVG